MRIILGLAPARPSHCGGWNWGRHSLVIGRGRKLAQAGAPSWPPLAPPTNRPTDRPTERPADRTSGRNYDLRPSRARGEIIKRACPADGQVEPPGRRASVRLDGSPGARMGPLLQPPPPPPLDGQTDRRADRRRRRQRPRSRPDTCRWAEFACANTDALEWALTFFHRRVRLPVRPRWAKIENGFRRAI